MNLLPSERVSVASASTPAELLTRLRAEVEPSAWLRNPFSRDHKPFQGEVVDQRFTLRRIIHYRNSFLPTVVGTVREHDGGAVLEATLRLHVFVIAFLTVWFGIATAGFVGFLAHALSGGATPLLALAPLALLLFGYALVQLAFRLEADKARRSSSRSPPHPARAESFSQNAG